mmetsp:Transcript_6057/g.21241  ORF Transcript_6057/g.21241 Transcript_6057/m.21241 type:complete len:199 (-) Transcript_6057:69-665(-)
MVNKVRCGVCDSVSERREPFLDLSLSIPDGASGARTSLEECLARHTSSEHLAGNERYCCETCGRCAEATKRIELVSLPKVLCVHLKRFHWHASGRSKLNTRVDCPLRSLDLAPYLRAEGEEGGAADPGALPGAHYDLAASVVHHGSSTHSGHYTAYGFSGEQGTWLEFNDEHVRAAAAADVQRAGAYLLFYVQRSASE